MELILFTKPQSILDIGVGFGKYGFLSREYLELWHGRQKYCDWKVRIDGIEAYRSYLTPVHGLIYNEIYIGNAVEILSNLEVKYDLILLIDVLEHFEYDQGIKLLSQCASVGKNTIVSTPRDIGIQEDIFENPFEIHKFQWGKNHFRMFKGKYFLPNKVSLICYIGEKASKLKGARVNRKIGRYFPFMIPLGRRLRAFVEK